MSGPLALWGGCAVRYHDPHRPERTAVLILRGPDAPVQALAFAPDAATLFAVHEYVGVHAWNLAAAAVRPLDVGGLRVYGEFAVHPGGRWAFGRRPSGKFPPANDACLLDLRTGVVGRHVAVSPDGARVVTVGYSNYDRVRPAPVPTERLYGWQMTADGPEYAWHLDPAPGAEPWRVGFAGGDTLVTEEWVPTGPSVLGMTPKRSHLCVRSARDGAARRLIDLPAVRIEQMLAAPDGGRVVVRDGAALWVYDPTDWAQPPLAVAGDRAHPIDAEAAAFHPSAPFLLLADNGPSITVYDAVTWQPARKWKWDAGALRAVAVSPDGSLAAAGGPTGTVVVWDLDL